MNDLHLLLGKLGETISESINHRLRVSPEVDGVGEPTDRYVHLVLSSFDVWQAREDVKG